MRIIRARILGFCMGVRRAVEMALRESQKASCKVYTIGPLIHNTRVLETLKEQGIVCLNELKTVPKKSTVIIRTHGVSPIVEKAFLEQEINILDATCPKVKASQNKAHFFAKKGYRIFLAGEENHAEISGIRGFAQNSSCFVVDSSAAADAVAAELYRKDPSAMTVLIGQTTISREEYKAIGKAILRYFPKLEIIDTICGATAERQQALRELCVQADALIIVGGKDSANARRLIALALDQGKPAWLVESPADLPVEIWNYQTVGLSAGASTPDELIDEIEEEITKEHLAKLG